MVSLLRLCLGVVQQAVEPDTEDDYDGPERIRHAETPELAREALIDSVVLIFKSQVEVALREQTAGHNALLLFVHLALQMMEEQLLNSFKELRAKQAEVQSSGLLEVFSSHCMCSKIRSRSRCIICFLLSAIHAIHLKQKRYGDVCSKLMAPSEYCSELFAVTQMS